MASENELQFGFDTSFFNKGVNKAMGKLGEMETFSKSIAKGMAKGFMNVIGKLGLVAGAVKLVKGAIANMPEIGQVMGITKDIFTRNLLYPVRKELFPLLQKLLNWVRDSQVRFVKWGENIVNVFKSVVNVATKVINLIKKITSGLSTFIERTFGISIKSIEDLFNIISFKVAVIVEYTQVFIERMLEGIKGVFASLDTEGIMDVFDIYIENLSKMVSFVKEIGAAFMSGFLPIITQVGEPLKEIFNTLVSIAKSWFGIIGQIFDKLFGGTEQLQKWTDAFQKIGEIYGTIILTAVETIRDVLIEIDSMLTKINEQGFGTWFKEGIGTIGENLGDLFSRRERKVQDAILRPNGDIIETDPKDTLVALKSTGTSFKEIDKPARDDVREISELNSIENNYKEVNNQKSIGPITFDFSGMQIVVQNGGKEEGEQFGLGLVDEMRNSWNREMERYGLV